MAALQAHHNEQLADTVWVGNTEVNRFLMDAELRDKAEISLSYYAKYPDALNERARIQLQALKEGGVDAFVTMAADEALERNTRYAISWATEGAINREAGMINTGEIIYGMYRAALERDTGERADSSSCRVEDLGDLSSPTFTAQKEGGCGFVKGGS